MIMFGLKNMLPCRLHSLPLLWLLILCVLTSPSSTIGYVWCVSADGHIVLEAAVAGDCAAESRSAHPENTTNPAPAFEDADGCGPCLDISASHSWGTARPCQDDLQTSLLASFVPANGVTAALLPERTLNTHFIVDTTPRIPAPILHHRSTVLLI